jgi:hypothetical protein
MIRFLLSLFKPFRWFIEKMDADYNQFIRILQLKLTMDNRRMKGLGNKSKQETENALLKQSFMKDKTLHCNILHKESQRDSSSLCGNRVCQNLNNLLTIFNNVLD